MFVTEMEKQQCIEEESILKYGVENGGRRGQMRGLCVCHSSECRRIRASKTAWLEDSLSQKTTKPKPNRKEIGVGEFR